MAQNQKPVFPLNPPSGQGVVLAAANTANDLSGTWGPLFTAGAGGGRLDWVKWHSSQTTPAALSATMVASIAVFDADGTSNGRMIAQGVITSVIASNTAIAQWACFDFVNGIYVTSNVTQINIGMNGGYVVPPNKVVAVKQSVFAGAQDRMTVTFKYGDFQ
jgi:hypothetical protein